MRRSLFLLFMGLCGLCVSAQSIDSLYINKEIKRIEQDSLYGKDTEEGSLWKSVSEPFKRVDRVFNGIDTLYISPNAYNLTLMLEHSTWYQRYAIGHAGSDAWQSIKFSPTTNMKIGLYGGWRWLFFGYSIDIAKILRTNDEYKLRNEFQLNLYTSKVGLDFFYRKVKRGFKIRSYKNFQIPQETYLNTNFDGMSTHSFGVGAYWVFNHRQFSYPAAYSQSTNQRKSAGSWILGAYFSKHSIDFDYTQLPSPLLKNLQNELKIGHIGYTDYTVSFGYTYNWVFAKNCLFNISVTPALGYKTSTSKSALKDDKRRSSLNADLIVRSGLVWNNKKYYIGASVVMETYEYRKPKFSLTNSYGALRVYAGFNFWKR